MFLDEKIPECSPKDILEFLFLGVLILNQKNNNAKKTCSCMSD